MLRKIVMTKAFFLPRRSARSPKMGEKMNCAKGKEARKNPSTSIRKESGTSLLKMVFPEPRKRGAKIGNTMVALRLSMAKVRKTARRDLFRSFSFTKGSNRWGFSPTLLKTCLLSRSGDIRKSLSLKKVTGGPTSVLRGDVFFDLRLFHTSLLQTCPRG